MIKQSLAAAFVAAASLAASPASAGIVFDGFGDAQNAIFASAAAPTATSGVVSVTDSSLSNLLRTISVSYLEGLPGTFISAAVSGDQPTGSGAFVHSQGVDVAGTSRIDWFFSNNESQNLTNWAGLLLNITVVRQDQIDEAPSITFAVRDADGTRLTSEFRLPTEIGRRDEPVSYGAKFSDFTADASNLGSVAGFDWSQFLGASLTINGGSTPDLDVAIDIVEVPAPAPLALLGLGLVGLGMARRRRA